MSTKNKAFFDVVEVLCKIRGLSKDSIRQQAEIGYVYADGNDKYGDIPDDKIDNAAKILGIGRDDFFSKDFLDKKLKELEAQKAAPASVQDVIDLRRELAAVQEKLGEHEKWVADHVDCHKNSWTAKGLSGI